MRQSIHNSIRIIDIHFQIKLMAHNLENLLRVFSSREIATSRQIQADLGASQATVSRLLKSAGDELVRIGRGPRTRYCRPNNLFRDIPIFRITEQGVTEHVADLTALSAGGFYVEANIPQPWLVGEAQDGLFPGLPYFLDDLRPQGYLGRQIARAMGEPYSPDPRLWSATQIVSWLLEHGASLPGDLVLGTRALQKSGMDPVIVTPEDYPQLAQRSRSGPPVGSSAWGEQPKFAAFTEQGHVLVKFSPRADGPESCRWRDILIAEHHALAVLAAHGIPSAKSRLIEIERRVFLEVQRFDRIGEHGRASMLSLAAVDAEFIGQGQDWHRSMSALSTNKLLSQTDLERTYVLQLFGQWIGNTDMHLGNLSLRPEEHGFSLLPIYDMTSMRWAPTRGELPEVVRVAPPIRDPRFAMLWTQSAQLALRYWHALIADSRVSEEFRTIAIQSKEVIEGLL